MLISRLLLIHYMLLFALAAKNIIHSLLETTGHRYCISVVLYMLSMNLLHAAQRGLLFSIVQFSFAIPLHLKRIELQNGSYS